MSDRNNQSSAAAASSAVSSAEAATRLAGGQEASGEKTQIVKVPRTLSEEERRAKYLEARNRALARVFVMAASGQAALAALQGIAAAAPTAPTVRNIGAFGSLIKNFSADYVFDDRWTRQMACMMVVTYAARQNVTLEAIVDFDTLVGIFALDRTQIAGETDEERLVTLLEDPTGYTDQIRLLALKILRLGSNAGKKEIGSTGILKIQHHHLVVVFQDWCRITSPEDKIFTVRAVWTCFRNHEDVELRNAGARLLGRGFTGINIFVSLIRELSTDAGVQALARLVASFSTEFTAMIATLQWILSDPNHFNFGYYVGIPTNVGARNYQSLVAIAIRCTSNHTVKAYQSETRNIRFSTEINDLIEIVKSHAGAVEAAEYDESWAQALAQLQTVATTSLAL